MTTIPTLVIKHAVTADMADGQPLPPHYDGAVWRVLRHQPDHTTLWRSISIRASAPPPAPRDTFGGTSKDQHL